TEQTGAADLAASKQIAERWTQIHDRVSWNEMPPHDADPLPARQRSELLDEVSTWLSQRQLQEDSQFGRVRGRRLTKLQLERTLHDLLGIDIPLATELPDEPRTNGFTTVADGQSLSHFQLEQHLRVVDMALDEAFRRAISEPDERVWTMTARDVARTDARRRCREPEMIGGEAVVWSSGLIFYGRLPATTARDSGWYRFTVTASALKAPQEHGVWCTVRTGPCISSAPLLAWVTAFEATPEPRTWTFETWLPKGHMLELRPGDTTLKKARFDGGQVGAGEGDPQNVPGVSIHSLTMERFHKGPENLSVRHSLLGTMKVERRRGEVDVIAENAATEVRELVHSFAQRAFRRPVATDVTEPYVQLALASLQRDPSPLAALRAGYRAVLCAPRFLYFHEDAGVLDDYALATRLSYFLWNTMPDAELLQAAASGTLHKPAQLQAHVDRMLDTPRGEDFLKDFAAEWLDLSLIDFTEPDRRLYPEFDIIVQQSMLAETHMTLQTMLRENLSVRQLMDSDDTFLNSRLARFYQIEGVEGDELRRVALHPDDHRGGILTQGAILKVTANGTTTSPVIRGIWVSDRLLGLPIPPPPGSVPAIEPDIRGATSIREMLAKHRNSESCAACHLKIDPPGFALENYDAAGQWRRTYGGSRGRGPVIDASFEFPDGRRFDDVRGFRRIALADSARLARNVAEKLLTYGTGAPIRFADRQEVHRVVEQTESHHYGLRSIVQSVVSSQIFVRK
ncbi:MAG: DUF1592 domain-containing protein, partial [Planctomycetaceae bacterium]|nr:DUF1592 domain-containing protein [Planctomycetaceae bacterium]